ALQIVRIRVVAGDAVLAVDGDPMARVEKIDHVVGTDVRGSDANPRLHSRACCLVVEQKKFNLDPERLYCITELLGICSGIRDGVEALTLIAPTRDEDPPPPGHCTPPSCAV